MKGQNKQVRCALLVSFLLLCAGVHAQTNALPSATASQPAESQDKSGTNPLVQRYTYVTPGFPIGGNRPYDFTFKTGIKKIW